MEGAGRSHVHLPITRENGDLLAFADVSLYQNGTQVFPTVYADSLDVDPITWPITFSPANVDLWLDAPGRYDLHAVGPSGYSAVYPGVDFLAPAGEQARSAPGAGQVSNTPLVGKWLTKDGSILRWMDPGLIGPHDHDGSTANSTDLGDGLASDENHTILGQGSVAGGSGCTLVGALSETAVADGTVVGPTSSAPPNATVLGDNAGTGQASTSVVLPFGDGGVLSAFVDSDSTHLRAMSSETAADALGTTLAVPGALPAGVTRPIWVRADAATRGLDARGDVMIGGTTGTVGFYGADGTVRASRPVGATGVLADLLDALEAYGLLVTPE